MSACQQLCLLLGLLLELPVSRVSEFFCRGFFFLTPRELLDLLVLEH